MREKIIFHDVIANERILRVRQSPVCGRFPVFWLLWKALPVFLLILPLAACGQADASLPTLVPETPTRQAWQVTLLTSDGEQAFASSAATVGEALAEVGVEVDERDFTWPPPGTPLTADTTVEYRPAREITVRVDGQEITVKANGETVGEALASAGIALLGLDFSLPAESAPVPAQGAIEIVRVRETISLAQRPIPFQNQTIAAPDVPLGSEEILMPGKPGVAAIRTRIRYENGVETARFEESEVVLQPPQDRLSGRGTKIVLQDVPEQPNLQYWRAISMYAVSYSPCQLGVPNLCSYRTASGLPLQKGVVAMSRHWYNALRGTQVYVPGYGVAVVADIGGGFPDGRPWLDLGYTDEDYVGWSRWVTVYFLAPAPEVVPYFME
ncbi:MAG: G5 domain-containing protein [Anaerolineales bacterium]